MVGLDMPDLALVEPQANQHRGGQKTQKNSRENVHARTWGKTCYSLAQFTREERRITWR